MKSHFAFPSYGPAFLLLFLFLNGCSKDKDENDIRGNPKSAIALSETEAPEGCLSLPRYLEQIRSLDPSLTARAATTKMSFTAKAAIRPNFELLASLGGFQYGDVSIFSLQQLQNISQAGCDSFSITDADGTEQTYQIKEKSRERIRGVAESGEELEYRWLSPARMQVTSRFISYDVPCGSEKNQIFVTQTKVYDWSGAHPAEVAADDAFSVDREFLDRLAEATGKNIGDFYSAGAEASGPQLTDQLLGLPTTPPRPELLACSAIPAPPDEGDGDGGGSNGGDGAESGASGSSGDAPPPPPPADAGGVFGTRAFR